MPRGEPTARILMQHGDHRQYGFGVEGQEVYSKDMASHFKKQPLVPRYLDWRD